MPVAAKSDMRKSQSRAALFFVAPSFLLYLTFVIAPVFLTIFLSFTYYDVNFGAFWVGLENYQRFFSEDRSLQIVKNTFFFTFFAVTLNVSVGLILALALNRAMPVVLLYFFRLAFFLPVIIAAAFVSIVWTHFYSDDLGVINYFLKSWGFERVRWLTTGSNAMMSVIIVDVWKNTGFFMIILIAALQSVPKQLTEAALLDGTSPLRMFWRITLPYISPVVFFCVVYATIGALQVYESIVILTEGGPGDATRSMTMYIAEEGFSSFELGYAASISVVLTVVILFVTIGQMVGSRYWVKY
ncbi:sugar ABC transporter permease [Pseudovibrio sp. Tun.PSC04-5.I4]|uniref:carbohydrate ABC transporter permease n=1 Tax=Pseudovibrio sp. Tun.PSC04-5.I4 TaxID=1798213 RepID=UPI0008878CA1|nr:sugar ABC transporter permease [Pseudovibrio sp. Tun.PSC04-5.I4]SDR48440.1 carbohydrate ABC transporter membrane protein 1, CUT1 family [Pseudovibrio sp. Tun.PSC04-5.I4]